MAAVLAQNTSMTRVVNEDVARNVNGLKELATLRGGRSTNS